MQIILCNEFYYRVRRCDSIKSISQAFNTDEMNILRNNNDIDLYPGEMISIRQNDYYTYIVKPCDNLRDISKRFCVDMEKIKIDNSLINEKLFIGQKIKIFRN